MKTKVDIDGIKSASQKLREINQIPFEDIIWMDGDTEIIVDPVVAENWRFMGLNNTDFIRYDFHVYPGELAEPDRWKGSL